VGQPMFDLDAFVADCRAALAADTSHEHVREVVARAVSNPALVLSRLGEPKRAGLHKLYQAHDLTILNVVWAPMMTLVPHNHEMWAVIGIYTGREDNIFWRCPSAMHVHSGPISFIPSPIRFPALLAPFTSMAAIFSPRRIGANGTRKPSSKNLGMPNGLCVGLRRRTQSSTNRVRYAASRKVQSGTTAMCRPVTRPAISLIAASTSSPQFCNSPEAEHPIVHCSVWFETKSRITLARDELFRK
jgi:hypothetical protein